MKTCSSCRHRFGNMCFFHGKQVLSTDVACKAYKDKPDKSRDSSGPRSNRDWLKDT